MCHHLLLKQDPFRLCTHRFSLLRKSKNLLGIFFLKRELLLTHDEEYEAKLSFQLTQRFPSSLIDTDIMYQWNLPYRKGDLEAGGGDSRSRPLYPTMHETPELRWGFIRKVYSIIAFQLLATVAVSATVVTVRPIFLFFATTGAGLALYIVIIITPFIGKQQQKNIYTYLLIRSDLIYVSPVLVLCPLYYYHQKHPVNYLLLVVFTSALAFVVGLTCAFTNGKVILESAILTTAVVLSLTVYTFWAAKRGYDFNFLGPFLFGALIVLVVFAMIQVFFPLGRTLVMIYGCLASVIFCGYIVYDTDNLIKRYTYDEYIWAAVSLYLDIINLFLSLLTIFRALQR
ncbi:Bax inhibitor-1 family protein [Raphanus sativus]|nr:Bax inhibitor-1 family protein [Raphanus sativus]